MWRSAAISSTVWPRPPGEVGVVDSGARLLSRYVLRQRVGSGGTAEVWRAWDELLDRPVAIKVLSVSLLPDLALRARLKDETQAVIGISHPGIVSILDFG